MSEADRERLQAIQTFPSLVKYLRDDLGWPIDVDRWDDVFFEYEAEELGIDAKTAAKVTEIKQLRPLADGQPWGIFFVKFEPKRLPVVALRRILGRLVINKRASTRKADRPSWHLHDLLFISNYGEGDHRQITFAHFAQDEGASDLPTLKVLGWDDADTASHIDQVHKELTDHLSWPDDETDLDGWRESWSGAFTLRHREVITTSKALSIRLSQLATDIRTRVNTILRVETDRGPIRKLMGAFKEALIHDLSEDDFADMYAQTITYGLLSARVSRPAGLVAENITDMVPVTNPFLRDLLSTFLTVGGRKGKIDFDEVGINDVVSTLRDANMEAVLRDFGDRNPQEDPVVHFYELFLKEYDPKKRIKRGVFYTPRPVVSFIVRSVHEILQKEFGLADGLADTSTWGDMAKQHKGLVIPKGAKPIDPFVQILDFACGTGTFLVEIIDVIYKTMKAKWKADGKTEMYDIPQLWSEYVADHLLSRLYGFELMMAPYAVAHMKVGLKLHETGYNFRSHERARIYLTNTLDEPKDFAAHFEFDAPALAHEAKAVNVVKQHLPPTVVVGNPPYSGRSWNLTPEIRRTVEPYKLIDGERIHEKGALQLEKSIQEDYIKFIRFGQCSIERSGIGIIGVVTSHGFLDNPTLRGMRHSLFRGMSACAFVDMHGNVSRREQCPDGSKDENVFDIKKTGTAISILRRIPSGRSATITHADLWGLRDTVKYQWLATNTIHTTPTGPVDPQAPLFLFIPQNTTVGEELNCGFSVGEVMPIHSKGVVTGRDHFVIDFDTSALISRMTDFRDSHESDAVLIERYKLNPTPWWSVAKARRSIKSVRRIEDNVRPLLYRPFDWRPCFYHASVFMSPRRPVMQHVEGNSRNIILITSRMTKGESFQHVLVTTGLAEAILLSSKTSNNALLFPLYLKVGQLLDQADAEHPQVTPNLSEEFTRFLSRVLHLRFLPAGAGNEETAFGPEDVIWYVYALFHSPAYRTRYSEFLKRDFPRILLPCSIALFFSLGRLGAALVGVHLFEERYARASFSALKAKDETRLVNGLTGLVSRGNSELASGHPKYLNGKVHINPSSWFEPVSEPVWSFHIGGYQVCEKWLKDRRGRVLTKEDIEHYCKIVAAIQESIRIMGEIDQVIEAHGGWPDAFITDPKVIEGLKSQTGDKPNG